MEIAFSEDEKKNSISKTYTSKGRVAIVLVRI